MKLHCRSLVLVVLATIALHTQNAMAQQPSHRFITIGTGASGTKNDVFRGDPQAAFEVSTGWRSIELSSLRILAGVLAGTALSFGTGDDCEINSAGECRVSLPSVGHFGLQVGGETHYGRLGLSVTSGPSVYIVRAGRRTSPAVGENKSYFNDYASSKNIGFDTRVGTYFMFTERVGLMLTAQHRYVRNMMNADVQSRGLTLGVRLY